MLIIETDQAKAGMVLAAPVVHPEHPEQELLKAGYALDPEVLPRLRELGIPLIYVEYPGLDDLDRHLAANLSPARQRLYLQIKQTVIAGQKRTRPAVSYTDYYANIREMICTLMSQGQHPVYIETMSRMGDDAVAHAATVSHLALLLGIKLETYLIAQRRRLPPRHAKEVVNIGVAGMLHDMGKLSQPESLRKYTVTEPPEDPAEHEQYQEHSRHGYEIIRNGVEPSAAAAVLHHHQRWDGTGFPPTRHQDGTTYQLKETNVHIFARILSAADLYDRLATSRSSRQRRPNIEVLHLLRTQYAGWCDPMVLAALQSITPPFPPGTILQLSDGTSAVVVEVDQADLYRPIVKRIVGDDLKLAESRLDLGESGAPAITHLGRLSIGHLIPSHETGLVTFAAGSDAG